VYSDLVGAGAVPLDTYVACHRSDPGLAIRGAVNQRGELGGYEGWQRHPATNVTSRMPFRGSSILPARPGLIGLGRA